MLLVLLVGAGVLGPYGARLVLPALVLAVALAVSVHAWRRAAWSVAVVLGAWATARALLPFSSPAVAATVVMPLDYVARYGVAVAVAAHLFATTSPTALHAALRAVRVPRTVAVPLVVMVRFVPVVLVEASAVGDALRLRGLAGPGAVLRHPMLMIERFMVPMIAASLRAGDDLSSAALLRGLGSRTDPVPLHPPRFTRVDAAWALGTVGLVTAGLWWGRC
nr:energy-coupling factor transporter transmembrane component T [Arsenicicoccus dermatophilus]